MTFGSSPISFGKIFSRFSVSISASSFSRCVSRVGNEISPESCDAGTTPDSDPTSAPTTRGTSAPQSISAFELGTTIGPDAGVSARRFLRLRLPPLTFCEESRCAGTSPLSAADWARWITASRSLPTSHSSIASTARQVGFGF